MRNQIIVAALVVFSSAGTASAASIVINDFESGTPEGWSEVVGLLFAGHGIADAPGGGKELEVHSSAEGAITLSRQIDVLVPSLLTYDYRAVLHAGWWDLPDHAAWFGNSVSAWVIGTSVSLERPTLPPGPQPFAEPYKVSGVGSLLLQPGQFDMTISMSTSFSRLTGGTAAQVWVDNITLTPVPEPSTFAMVLGALVAIFAARRAKLLRR